MATPSLTKHVLPGALGDILIDVRTGGRESSRPAVVVVHGFKGFKDWGFWPEMASRLRSAGYGVVRFNFSHSGIGPDLETFSEVGLFESGTYTRE
ncbi:MAG TPA: hypothetical protein VK132_06200, partial [Gemmatimonadales bacterium]|nr:hypothetical protein [Gemmatimonadales bacterium]